MSLHSYLRSWWSQGCPVRGSAAPGRSRESARQMHSHIVAKALPQDLPECRTEWQHVCAATHRQHGRLMVVAVNRGICTQGQPLFESAITFALKVASIGRVVLLVFGIVGPPRVGLQRVCGGSLSEPSTLHEGRGSRPRKFVRDHRPS